MAKDRTLDPDVYQTAVNLRIAGMSERAVYESMRDYLAEPPSYRDLRVAYATANVRYRADVTARRHEGKFLETRVEGNVGSSSYLKNRRIMHTVDFTSDRDEAFNRKYLLGYLARAGADLTIIDDEAFAEDLADIYEGEGSP